MAVDPATEHRLTSYMYLVLGVPLTFYQILNVFKQRTVINQSLNKGGSN